MKIDLNKGISLEIEGEIGKFNTLPIDTLIKIAQNLQDLLKTIAVADLDSRDPIHLDNFNIELSGFKEASAVPQFVFTHRIQESIGDVDKQRTVVNKTFENLMEISSKSEYIKLRTMYPDASRRNSVVNKLYDFTNSFGNSPVSIVNYKAKNKIVPIFQIKRFNIDAKKELVTEIVENGKIEKEEHAVASVKLRTNNKGKTTRIIEQLYKKSATTLSYSPDVIVFENKVYNLHFPLRSSLLKEDDYFVIHNEMLDIIGTGITEDDAEKSFAEEFDFIYKRYNQIEEINLSDKLKKIKYFLNYIVKSIE